ncbi:MAG: DUF2071 domain-containing protein [Gemmatimonadetes bacterium]|nr:DUF2071 domain-containing protein [Gemmatimonadota bacterium]
MQWHDLLFAHWPVPLGALREHVPARLDIDTFDGQAWIGVVPFRMEGVRARRFPPVPGATSFPELNVRTYVRPHDHETDGEARPAVWFFSLDAASRLVVRMARAWYGLPYFHARMRVDEPANADQTFRYRSSRNHDGPAVLDVSYTPTGPAIRSNAGTLEHFLTERYRMFAMLDDALVAADVMHVPWSLQPAEAEFRENTMTAPLAVTLPDTAPLLHYAARLDVLAWKPHRV